MTNPKNRHRILPKPKPGVPDYTGASKEAGAAAGTLVTALFNLGGMALQRHVDASVLLRKCLDSGGLPDALAAEVKAFVGPSTHSMTQEKKSDG